MEFNIFHDYTLEQILSTAVAVVVVFSVLIAILYSIWGGFLMITSGGNEEKIKPAVNHIRHAAIGLIALLLILFVAPKVLDLFSLPYGEFITPRAVFSRIGELSNNLFQGGVSTPSSFDGSSPASSDLPANFSDL